MISNPTDRFTGRVDSYRRYRPTYPAAVVELLTRECSLGPASRIADIAAGTGLLTAIFLAAGFPVTAVEPNAEMRAACSTLEQHYPKLRIVNGTAEATALPARSIELITVAQAMHWFHLQRARAEFVRILEPGGWCAVLYNNRRPGGDPFHDGYEQLLRTYGIDYLRVQRQHMAEDRLAEFFARSAMQHASFPNAQSLTLEALEGRLLSSSYIPQPGHPQFAALRAATERLFDTTQSNGLVTLEYDCVVCYGRLADISA